MSEFRYFQSVKGRAVLRYGTGTYIGAVREISGFRWSPKIVQIPKVECTRYVREDRDAVKNGDLIEFTELAAKEKMLADEREAEAEQHKREAEQRDAEALAKLEQEEAEAENQQPRT